MEDGKLFWFKWFWRFNWNMHGRVEQKSELCFKNSPRGISEKIQDSQITVVEGFSATKCFYENAHYSKLKCQFLMRFSKFYTREKNHLKL